MKYLAVVLVLIGSAWADKPTHPEIRLSATPTNEIEIQAHCDGVERAASEVMEALGFRALGSRYSPWAAVLYEHAYQTRDWKDVTAKLGRIAETPRGLFTNTYGLRPRGAELIIQGFWIDQTAKKQGCRLTLVLDFGGWERGFFEEGPQRYKSTLVLENYILNLARWQAKAKGLID